MDNQIVENLSENFFQSKGKNFILKSDYLNNTNNSKKNSNFYDSNNNNEKTQKDDEIEKNKMKYISPHISDKELDLHYLNNNIFNENKNNSNKSHSNIIQDYYQNFIEDNVGLINNKLNNINLSGNEINENNKINNNNINSNHMKENISQDNQNEEINQNININNIINDANNDINHNPRFLNQNMNINSGYQPKINFHDINPNQINPMKNQSDSYINQLNPFIMNQSEFKMNSEPNFNPNILINNQNNTISQQMQYNSPIMPIPYPNSQINLLTDKKEEYLINNCVSLCKEQIECRQLQKMIDTEPSLASNVIYSKIKEKIQEISFDQFGNYFIQKVIEYLNEEQIKEILYKKISHNFRSFCFNQHGTRVVQKIFGRITENEPLLNYFNNLLFPNLKDFVIDQNASHIIIKYVNTLPSPKNDFIIQFLLENASELAIKKYSCCVLQKCIEYSNNKQKKDFLKVIAVQSFGLFNDQYGNYVVQYCINLCDYEINKIFVDNFLSNIINFSTQKYSSNIIEKCMDCCDEATKELICQKYCNKDIVEKLLFDMYGNYVVQKVIHLSKEPLTSQYLEMIGPLMKNLNNFSFGQKLYNKLITSFPYLSMYIGIDTKSRKNKKFKNKKNKGNFDGYLGNNN